MGHYDRGGLKNYAFASPLLPEKRGQIETQSRNEEECLMQPRGQRCPGGGTFYSNPTRNSLPRMYRFKKPHNPRNLFRHG